jgi:hypothetical protein
MQNALLIIFMHKYLTFCIFDYIINAPWKKVKKKFDNQFQEEMMKLFTAGIVLFSSILISCSAALSVQDPTTIGNSQKIGVESVPANYGTVLVTVYADSYQNGNPVSTPYAGVGVYGGPWQADKLLGITSNNGQVSVSLPAGNTNFSAFILINDESDAFSGTVPVTVTAQKTVDLSIHLAPTPVVINAYSNPGTGYALYISGQGSYLGNWTNAYRMTYSSSINGWTYQGNLPIGAQFKVLLGAWINSNSVSVSSLTWQTGNNLTITAPYDNYESVISDNPVF